MQYRWQLEGEIVWFIFSTAPNEMNAKLFIGIILLFFLFFDIKLTYLTITLLQYHVLPSWEEVASRRRRRQRSSGPAIQRSMSAAVYDYSCSVVVVVKHTS